jgi:hypothetical protein
MKDKEHNSSKGGGKMTGTEKQKRFALAIMDAIKNADTSTYPYIAEDKIVIDICQHLEAGEIAAAKKKWNWPAWQHRRALERITDGQSVDAGKLIDEYKHNFRAYLR